MPFNRATTALWLLCAFLLGAGLYATAIAPRAQAQDTIAPAADTVQPTQQDAPQPPPTLAGDSVRQPFTAGDRVAQARADVETPVSARLVSLLGMVVLLVLGWLMSTDRRAIPWRVIVYGIGLQLVFAVLILKTPAGEQVFSWINDVVVALLGFTVEGAKFLFGNLVDNTVPVTGDGALAPGTVAQTGAFFAFNVLPTIIFFSSIMTLAYHLGIMQAVVKGVAWVMQRTMRTSGAETLSASGNIFMGQTEAPLLIKPFVATMTKSELMAVMTGGFATVAGGVLAAYVGMLVAFFPDIAGHLLAASVMSAPAALVFAKLMYPEKEEPLTRDGMNVQVEKIDANAIDAAARGASEGLSLALNVAAMLLAFIAIVALVNALLGWATDAVGLTGMLRASGIVGGDQRLTLEVIFGWLLAPLAWVMGVPWRDAVEVGSLLGIKTVLNEFVAYLQLANTLSADAGLSPRSVVIATYALCGFANFSSIGIQIGGIGGLAPSRRSDLARIGMRAMIAGTLASFMTATIAGLLT